ncbi:MAG: LacI family DNA-binding transcriptional regulator [Tepidisphaeraceae bacterium]
MAASDMTLQKVAERAGVSTSTVSRVINSMPGITAATAEVVRRAMRELAYTPPLRRRVAQPIAQPTRPARVGFVVFDLAAGKSHVPAYDYLLRGVAAAAGKFSVDLNVTFENDPDTAVQRLAGSGFDGLILHGSFPHLDKSRPLHHIPTAWLLGNPRRPIWGDQIMPDNATVGQIAANYLLERGHKHSIVFGIVSSWWMPIRELAFRQAIEDAGQTVQSAVFSPNNAERSRPQDVETAIAEFIRIYKAADPKPTGLFITEDWLVRPFYNALHQAGISIGPGADLDVIACNNDRATSPERRRHRQQSTFVSKPSAIALSNSWSTA